MKMIRLAVAAAGVVSVALLLVAAASAKPPAPPVNVACGQDALVAAINAANSAGGGTLNLAHGCDYQLTTSPDDSENGLPAITTAIKINGNQATIDGTDSFRDFEVDGPGGSLSAHDLTITGGSADVGGGIANFAGTVMLDHSQVTGNAAILAGGGIASASINPDFSPSSTVATLTVRKSSVSGNQQTLDGPDGGAGGGGILNLDGTAMLDHSQVNGNDAEGFFGGGIASGDYFGFGGQTILTVDHSQVSGNTAPNAGGGGIQNASGSVTVKHSEVDGNTSLNGGGISSGNQGNPDGTADLRVDHSEVNGNTATAGPSPNGPPIAAGGIANGGTAELDHSRVDNNTATRGIGAGIVNHATMTVSHSEVNGNTAAASGMPGSAGGILNAQGPPGTGGGGTLTLDHSKVDNNSAGGNGGGIANGVGGMLVGGDLTLKHSEVRHNSAGHGGGIFNNGGTVTLMGTKVTDNTPDNCEPTNSIAGCTN
jgi:hypothetical protein